MSLSLLAWLILFSALAVLAVKRPVWGVCLYMLTFFALPAFWWWGGPIASFRWNLYGGVGLLISVIASRMFDPNNVDNKPFRGKVLWWLAGALLVNATIVHIALAANRPASLHAYLLLAKFVLLFFLIVFSIRTKRDFRIVLLAIILGGGYLGYEATINGRGRLRANRLEGIGAPGATGANQLACLLVTTLPLSGAFFLGGRRWEKLAMLPIAPMTLNVVLLCNSRGAFLSALASAGAFLIAAPRPVRRQAVKLLMLGAIALYALMGDPRIVERFLSTFAGSEERDNSAASRLVYWTAGMKVILDHPFGTGGNGFKNHHGPNYLAREGIFFDNRAVHNGFINEACQWGIQGFALRMAFVGFATLIIWRTSIRCARRGQEFEALLGCAMISGMVAFLVNCVFGDRLDAEWGYWLGALTVGYATLYWEPSSEELQDDDDDDNDVDDHLDEMDDDGPIYTFVPKRSVPLTPS
jgi:putative inorganic carbon (hco3(-)) transporter